jgi:hypothetical protein
MSNPPRCGKRYGHQHKLICRRLAGHKGSHAQRLKDYELEIVLDIARTPRRAHAKFYDDITNNQQGER